MALTPEERQQAIDVLSKVLMDKTTGHTKQESDEAAAAVIDQAIADQESGGHAAG